MVEPVTMSGSAAYAGASCACAVSGPACIVVVGGIAVVGIVAISAVWIFGGKKPHKS